MEDDSEWHHTYRGGRGHVDDMDRGGGGCGGGDGGDEDINNFENSSSNGVSIVSLFLSAEHLAYSVYQEIFNSIIVDKSSLNSALQSNLSEVISHIKSLYSPTLFLIHPRLLSHTQLIELLQAPLSSSPHVFIDYLTPKSTNFNPNIAIDLLTTKFTIKDSNNNNRIIDPVCDRNQKQTYKRIESLIDIQNIEIRQSLGALLTHIQKHVFHLDSGVCVLSSLKHSTSIDKYMRIDDSSFSALQIFHQDAHPNVVKENQRGKEGFSLFSMLDRTKSVAGRIKLKEMMSKPFNDRDLIIERQNSIEILMKPYNRQFLGECEKKLRHIQVIPKLLLRIKKVEATASDYCKLISSIENGVSILQLMIQFTNDDDKDFGDKLFIQKLAADIDIKTLQDLSYFLAGIFDFKQQQNSFGASAGDKDTNKLVIKEGFDSHLDELRFVYESMDQYLVDAAHKILDITPLLNIVRVEYIQQIGYLVLIQQMDVHLVENDEAFQFVFAENGSHNYKHPVVDELDSKFGDIKSIISDYQNGLLLQIEEDLLEHESMLQLFSHMLSNLDALISMAVISQEKKLVKPDIVEDNVVVIKNGRHPLQELTVDVFVPNDTFISDEKPVSLITGPNSSGKSVYLKQVGLIVYLAHIGCFVPAEQAIIGLTDRIMTRINSVETVSAPQSAFSLDLCQASKILNYATSRSLILIDEFGKGTSPIDGISILAATIRHVALKRFKAMFTLHFTEIFNKDILTDVSKESIYTFRMDILVNDKKNSDDVDVDVDGIDQSDSTPLFKLRVGLAPDSLGLRCARNSSLPEEVVQRAFVIKSAIKERKRIPPRVNSGALKGLHNTNNQELLETFLATDWSDPSNRHKSLLSLQTIKMKLL